LRLGIFGGTFNPVHLAHLIVAQTLVGEAGIDRVVFIPSATPPHKEEEPAGAAHRLAMVRLAVADNPSFEVSEEEIHRGGTSYSVDTLRALRRDRPGDTLSFIIGMDAFRDVASWRDSPALFSLAGFTVIPRPGHDAGDVPGFLPPGVTAGPATGPSDRPVFPIPGCGTAIRVVPVPPLGISSSDIRRRVREGLSIRYLVPRAVEEHILAHRLYRET
jgi:nicotinate-nucleotide adenylyltransferase